MGISHLKDIRAEKSQELIYKNGTAGITRASVTIIFCNKNKQGSPPGYEQNDTITVVHQLEVGKDSKYFIDNRVAPRQKVIQLFCSVKLNVNNPHFLIMQGRVTKVINMKPIELLGLVEEAAGTSLYQVKREQAQNHLKKKEMKVQEINNIIKEEVSPKLD
jgi:structural maintenance of chromosome 2